MMKNDMIGKPLFSNVFGESNTLKVLDFLFMGKDFDFTLTQMSSGTKLSRTAIRNAVEDLMEEKIVVVSRMDDKSTYYKINKSNPKFGVLEKLYEMIKKDIILA